MPGQPFYACHVQAGFPSPADDYLEGRLDLNAYLVKNPAATFFVRVSGESMIGAGIQDGAILVVDRSLTPTSGKIVIAAVDGALTVKRLEKTSGTVRLVADNPSHPSLILTEGMDMVIWGVVTSVIHKV